VHSTNKKGFDGTRFDDRQRGQAPADVKILEAQLPDIRRRLRDRGAIPIGGEE
jgi:hypothetical protein